MAAIIDKEHIARISYGKDSLKMLNVIYTRRLPLDRITTTDVWATDTIPAWLPPLQEFRDRMDQWIWDKYHIEVEHLCARNKDGTKRTYEQMFYHIPKRKNSQSVHVERERERRIGPGSILGFPDLWNAWCQAALKRNAKLSGAWINQGIPWNCGSQLVPETQNLWGQQSRDFHYPGGGMGSSGARTSKQPVFSEERQTRRKDRNIVEYLGIAADEPKRFGQLNDKKRAPLVEFGIEEDLCGLYCQYADCLAPTYETSCRDGCWFCHNQGVDQLRLLRSNWPDYWALLMKWDLDSPISFKADGHTVHDFDRRFRMEDEKLIPADRRFRWKMLDNPPKFMTWGYEQLSLFE